MHANRCSRGVMAARSIGRRGAGLTGRPRAVVVLGVLCLMAPSVGKAEPEAAGVGTGAPLFHAASAAIRDIAARSVRAAVRQDPVMALSSFADPGFAKFGSFYYLYGTSIGFEVSSSAQPDRGYRPPKPSLHRLPGWVGRSPTGRRHLWAPDVFSVAVGTQRPRYVMYFTGYDRGTAARLWGANCIGVATSDSPSSGFVAPAHPICAKARGFEAIDPTMYQARNGNRYLVFKRHGIRNHTFAIRAIQMGPRGLHPLPGGLRRTLVSSTDERMEAPSLINHGHQVWLFLARRSWRNCSYATDAWSARSISRGRFVRRDWVMTSATTGLCGPGGASVVQDGPVTRIAFQAWKSPHSAIRQTWIGALRWTRHGPRLRTA